MIECENGSVSLVAVPIYSWTSLWVASWVVVQSKSAPHQQKYIFSLSKVTEKKSHLILLYIIVVCFGWQQLYRNNKKKRQSVHSTVVEMELWVSVWIKYTEMKENLPHGVSSSVFVVKLFFLYIQNKRYKFNRNSRCVDEKEVSEPNDKTTFGS